MKKAIFLLIIVASLLNCKSQKNSQLSSENNINPISKPKLVIGIVVDQMRYDYLIRFENKYGNGGFKRLLKDGYNLKNTHHNHVPTHTAVGHASIYTGTTPENHGIIGNYWYDKFAQEIVSCVNDTIYKTVGSNSKKGANSPHRMLTTTITDQLQLAQNRNGKVIGISIKDRGAILPVGHTANAAYWYEGGDTNKWITSSFYMDKLPLWVENFNAQNLADSYLNQQWNTYYDISTYTESIADNNKHEKIFKGKETPTFPYDLSKLRNENGNYNLIKSTPFGNTFTTDFIEATILGEQLGKGKYIDFLAISYSSTDYIGHSFGVASKEIEDTYIRLDKDIERLLKFLDTEVGVGNYSLFLTSDHGVVDVSSYLTALKIPSGYFDSALFRDHLNKATARNFGSDKLIEKMYNMNVFLDKAALKRLRLSKDTVVDFLIDEIIQYEGIYKVVSAKTLQTTNFTDGILSFIQNGYNQKLSGDILYAPNPATVSSRYLNKGGTSHGLPYSYDTHVPLIFYGAGFKKGASNTYYPIINIAPTIATLLRIEFPNGTTGKVISEVLE